MFDKAILGHSTEGPAITILQSRVKHEEFVNAD
jgi:hypothetical protein